jgi:tryptophanyl-tRNA synthetase
MAPRGKRVLSGVQPSGAVHIGNYFGAIRQWIELQEENEAAYFLADYHSMTTIRDAAERRAATFDLALAFLCLGVDTKRSILYRQSDVPEVNELAWCLSSVTPMGLLERAHAYKDKVASGAKADHGLFAYPVLMAADILIHRADFVPVGGDQKQHVELTRDMAQKFNQTYGEVFTIPEPFIPEGAAFVPGTDGRKMSKTYGNAIEIFAPEKLLRKQVMGIVTDSTPVEAPKNLDQPLIRFWDVIGSEDERAQIHEQCEQGGVGYGDMKKRLVERVLEFFAEARERREALAADPDQVEDILADGARRASEGAAPLLDAVREAAGIGPPRR